MTTQCEARVYRASTWYADRCGKQGKHERQGHNLCTVHARQFDSRGFLKIIVSGDHQGQYQIGEIVRQKESKS